MAIRGRSPGRFSSWGITVPLNALQTCALKSELD